MITEKGRILWAVAIGNLLNGYSDTVKEANATTLTGQAATKWTAEQFKGQDVYSGSVVGTILSNTEKVLTVARWEKLPTSASPLLNRTEKGEPPIGSSAYSIVSGASPAAWVGISEDEAPPEAKNENLKGEIGTGKEKNSEFGLVRSLAVFKYLGGKEYEVKVTFTAKEKDATPVTLKKIGIFNAQNGGVMMFESKLTSNAEIKESSDAVTITDVVQGS